MTVSSAGKPSPVDQESERAPASDLASERMVLGFMLSNPAHIDDVSKTLKAEDFYSPKHAEVYSAILAARELGHPTEPVAFAAYLADRGELGRLGGVPFLHECVNLAPLASGNPQWYADRLIETATRREYQVDGVRLVQAATAPGHTTDDLAALAQSLATKLRPRREKLAMAQLGSLINPALDDIEQRKNRPAGIQTGFSDLDRLLGGLRKKQLITIAGATAMGKSVALIDIARHVTIEQGFTAGFFSFEMSNEEIFERILSAETRVPHFALRDGNVSDEDWARIGKRLGPMSNAPLFLSDRGSMTVAAIHKCCEALREAHGLDIAFVDHMHITKPSNPRIIEQHAIIGDVSRDLKQMAMDLDIPVIAAAQLNRNPGQRADKRPQLSDLKGSSSIEQDSNVVILIHRPDYYDKDSPRRGEADFVVDKHRNGPTDTITVAAQLHFSRFVDMAIV